MRLPPGLAPLRHRDFTLFTIGQAITITGTWIENTATTFLLYEITRSPVLLGVGGVMRAAPIILFALVGGAVADRIDRRRMVIVCKVAMAVISLLLALLVVSGRIEFWHIYIANFVGGMLAAFEAPARQAFYPTLVPRSELQNAITLNAMQHRTGTLIGPAVAGVLIANVGLAAPFVVNTISFAAVVASLVAMRTRHVVTAGARLGMRSDLAEGLRFVRAHKVLPYAFLVDGTVGLLSLNTALITVFAIEVLGVDAQGLGLLLSGVGVGGTLGIVALVFLGDIRRKGRAMLAATVVYGLLTLAFSLTRRADLAFIVLMLVGAADSFQHSVRATIIQLAATDQYRGRISSMLIILSRGGHQLSAFPSGISASLVGAPGAAAITGAIAGAVALVVAVRSPALREFSSRREPSPQVVATAAETTAGD